MKRYGLNYENYFYENLLSQKNQAFYEFFIMRMWSHMVYKQKISLAAYATEPGVITMLNSNQLNIARKIISAIKPVEKITKIVSTS